MEEKEPKPAVHAEHLNELQKNVLDEFILDLKNSEAIIPLHEEKNAALYIRKFGRGSFLNLLRTNLEYIHAHGNLTRGQETLLKKLLF